jgi:hypothetical protein
MASEFIGPTDVFVGSAMLNDGTLTRGQLRWNYQRLFPDIYHPNETTPHFAQRVRGAWLWSGRQTVISGLAAAILHGARIGPSLNTIELIGSNCRPPRGIIVRHQRIESDEIVHIDGLPVTNPARTALDIGRHADISKQNSWWEPLKCRDFYPAVVHLDALARATNLVPADVNPLLDRHRGFRGVDRAGTAIGLMDGGALTPRETSVRLTLFDVGPSCLRTDFTIGDDRTSLRIAIGYDATKVGVVFDPHRPLPKTEWAIVEAGDNVALNIAYRVRGAVYERDKARRRRRYPR